MQTINFSNEPSIRVQGLRKVFGDQVVLEDVNLEVEPGEIMVVMGGSGSGKSTLLRCMIGSLFPDSGSIELYGSDITSMDEDSLNEIRKRFGVLFQSGALYNSMTVNENIRLPMEEHTELPQSTMDFMVKLKLSQVALETAGDKFPSQISGGMKKRAGLARALALDPKILFYDEPSAGLDPITSAQIDKLIIDLSKKSGATSVVITHEMDSAFAIADRMAYLHKGKILRVGKRVEFEQLRDAKGEELMHLSEADQMIRQFLLAETEGPLTEERLGAGFSDFLLGDDGQEDEKVPSVQSSR